MRTRDKILETARQMFNELGIDNTSAKMIATELGISDGNLRYYFRTKEDLVYALYMQLVDGFNQQFTPYTTEEAISLGQTYHTLHSVFERLYTHRYLMADFMAIMRKYPKIEQHYQQLIQSRKQLFRRLIEIMQKEGIFKDDIPHSQYENVIDQFYILSDAWIGHAEVFFKDKDPAKKVKHYARLTFSLFVPYLSTRGMYEYINIFNND
jgi:AcrR family transcriptional regulator